jgi:hypothetical protein
MLLCNIKAVKNLLAAYSLSLPVTNFLEYLNPVRG